MKSSSTLRSIAVLVFCTFAAMSADAQPIDCSGGTYIDLRWTVLHEGNLLFVGNAPRSINEIRNDAMGFESHNKHQAAAKARIAKASNNEVRAYVTCIQETAKAELVQHLGWVAVHEGQLEVLRDDQDKGRFDDIRSVYFNYQSHNPDARNLMAGVSNEDISEIIDGL
jgi:hypothetical protein